MFIFILNKGEKKRKEYKNEKKKLYILRVKKNSTCKSHI